MRILSILVFASLLLSCKSEKKQTDTKTTEKVAQKDSLIYPEEVHFKSLRQVTFGGDNAEAYWSFDDKQLVFQSNYKNWNVSCDQMFLMNADETFKDSIPPMISTGKGRTTCAYFLPDNKHIILWFYCEFSGYSKILFLCHSCESRNLACLLPKLRNSCLHRNDNHFQIPTKFAVEPINEEH